MIKTMGSYLFLSILALFSHIEKEAIIMSTAKEITNEDAIELKSLELDGFRYISKLHKDVGVHVFWNNGVYGTGLLLSFFGELNSKVLNIRNIRSTKVILEDDTQLTRKQIRDHGNSIILGNDKKSLGFRIDLDIAKIANIKYISGEFDIVWAEGAFEVISDVLQDNSNSEESKIGIGVNMASNYGKGRYYVFIIENAENILELTVLDENGNEFKQTNSFKIFGVKNECVKVYVDKKKGPPFALKLKRAKKLHVQSIPFVLENISLMSY